MTISEKQFAVLLLFFLLTVPSSTAEMESATIQLSDTDSGLQLSSVYLSLSLIYLSLLAYWIQICIKTKPSVRRIHTLMAGLIILKAVTMICKYYEALSGTHGSDLFFYISQFIISGFRLSIVIQLLAIGWSLMQPFLQKVDRIALRILIPLQILANIVETVIGENVDFNDWNNLEQMLKIVQLITCCATFLPVLSSTSPLSTDGMAPRNLENLDRFRSLLSTVVIYLVFLRGAKLLRNNGHDELKNAIDDDNLIRWTVVMEMFGLLFYTTACEKIRKYFVHVYQDE